MAQHQVHLFGSKLSSGLDHSVEHRLASDRVQHFRKIGFHSATLAGSENNDVRGHERLPMYLAGTTAAWTSVGAASIPFEIRQALGRRLEGLTPAAAKFFEGALLSQSFCHHRCCRREFGL